MEVQIRWRWTRLCGGRHGRGGLDGSKGGGTGVRTGEGGGDEGVHTPLDLLERHLALDGGSLPFTTALAQDLGDDHGKKTARGANTHSRAR